MAERLQDRAGLFHITYSIPYIFLIVSKFNKMTNEPLPFNVLTVSSTKLLKWKLYFMLEV